MTLLMGIVNTTSDSFSDGGRFLEASDAIAQARRLIADGADLIDVGGESTRPGAERVDAVLEASRVLPVVSALAAEGAQVSIDTMRAGTAAAAVAAGARLVNDVSGGLADPAMLDTVAATDADLAIGHWRGHSADMYADAQYDDAGREVAEELLVRVDAAIAAGIARERIVLDPGIGFGKRAAQNWAVLQDLPRLAATGHRVLVGTSRKRFLAEALGEEADEERRDLATAVTSVLAAQAGAWAVRVHAARASRDALRIATAWSGGGNG